MQRVVLVAVLVAVFFWDVEINFSHFKLQHLFAE